jgi:hypothetical protein
MGVGGQVSQQASTRGENWRAVVGTGGGLEFLNMKYSCTRLIHGPPLRSYLGFRSKNRATAGGRQSAAAVCRCHDSVRRAVVGIGPSLPAGLVGRSVGLAPGQYDAPVA